MINESICLVCQVDRSWSGGNAVWRSMVAWFQWKSPIPDVGGCRSVQQPNCSLPNAARHSTVYFLIDCSHVPECTQSISNESPRHRLATEHALCIVYHVPNISTKRVLITYMHCACRHRASLSKSICIYFVKYWYHHYYDFIDNFVIVALCC